MNDLKSLEGLLTEKINELVKENKHQYVIKIAVWIAQIFSEETKKYVTHRYDPPWDCSGEIVDTGEPFDLSEFTTLESFVENEYNGTTIASYVSGCGFFHETYRRELEDITSDWVFEQLTLAVEELLPFNREIFNEFVEEANVLGEKTDTPEYIARLILWEDIIGDVIVFELPFELIEMVGKMDLAYLIKLGKE